MFKHDWLEGIWHRKLYLILSVLAAFFSCTGIHSSIIEHQKTENISNGTFMDYWIYLVDGCQAYKFDWYNSFVIPIRWICFITFLLIGVNNYMLSDLKGWGYQVLVHSKSRLNWWISKLMWSISYTLCYFFVSFCTVLIYCISRNVAVNFKPTLDIMKSQATESFMKFVCGGVNPAITYGIVFKYYTDGVKFVYQTGVCIYYNVYMACSICL